MNLIASYITTMSREYERVMLWICGAEGCDCPNSMYNGSCAKCNKLRCFNPPTWK